MSKYNVEVLDLTIYTENEPTRTKITNLSLEERQKSINKALLEITLLNGHTYFLVDMCGFKPSICSLQNNIINKLCLFYGNSQKGVISMQIEHLKSGYELAK